MTDDIYREYHDGPKWEREGGEGLPLDPNETRKLDSDKDYTTFLFTCVNCGRRLCSPPGPPADMICGNCGGDYVCHTFDPAEYARIRWYGDPRPSEERSVDSEPDPSGGEPRTDGGRDLDTVQVDLARRDGPDDGPPAPPLGAVATDGGQPVTDDEGDADDEDGNGPEMVTIVTRRQNSYHTDDDCWMLDQARNTKERPLTEVEHLGECEYCSGEFQPPGADNTQAGRQLLLETSADAISGDSTEVFPDDD